MADDFSVATEKIDIDLANLDFESNCVVTRLEDDTYRWMPVCEDDKWPHIRCGMVIISIINIERFAVLMFDEALRLNTAIEQS